MDLPLILFSFFFDNKMVLIPFEPCRVPKWRVAKRDGIRRRRTMEQGGEGSTVRVR